MLETPTEGAHRFYLNRLTAEGQRFEGPTTSAVGGASTHQLRAGNVQPLDVNGDGFVGVADVLSVLSAFGTGC